MKKMAAAAAFAALSAPAFAGQPTAQSPAPAAQPAQAQRGPHTLRGQLTLFQMNNFSGEQWVVDTSNRRVVTEWPIRSLSIHPGDRWQICARTGFRDCIVLDRSVPDASVVGITNQIGSARPAPEGE